MRKLTLMIVFLRVLVSLPAQNPHGASMKIDCASCHSPAGWEISASYWKSVESQAGRFQHRQTRFDLTGRHATVDCASCHQSLTFSEVGSDCISCHADIHQQSVGTDCARCHNANNWLVDNITEIHQQNGFPLLGQHAIAQCDACHHSETTLRFDRLGNQCIDCHKDNYAATTAPNHKAAGYSTDCFICHDVASPDWLWQAGGGNHLFFPLTKGHNIQDCTQCHTGGNFSNTPTDCFACHENDFNATSSPDHEAGNFPTDCKVCHTTDVGWPATDFKQHDQLYFPIFSGRHEGAWNQCTECHTTANDFKAFSCTDCHEHNNSGKLANKHNDVSGYSFNSMACYNCHPKGN